MGENWTPADLSTCSLGKSSQVTYLDSITGYNSTRKNKTATSTTMDTPTHRSPVFTEFTSNGMEQKSQFQALLLVQVQNMTWLSSPSVTLPALIAAAKLLFSTKADVLTQEVFKPGHGLKQHREMV